MISLNASTLSWRMQISPILILASVAFPLERRAADKRNQGTEAPGAEGKSETS